MEGSVREKTSSLIIAFLGPPLHGKTTLGRIVAGELGVKFVDHETHCRVPFFGPGHPDPDAAPEVRAAFNVMQAASYDILFAVAGAHLDLARPLVVAATFVSGRSQGNLAKLAAARPSAQLRCFWCFSDADDDEAVEKRLAGRTFGQDYFGGVNDLGSYRAQKARWLAPPSLPHRVLDTFGAPVDACVEEALAHIRR
ncbi:MAG: AAA family ATPase [bacterium]|nr:AAA family ATPase [bacterium]